MIVLFPALAIAGWDNIRALAPGTQVRVVAGNAQKVSGTLESVTDTTLLLLNNAGRQPFEKTQIASISVKKPGHRQRNILIGLGVGLAAGAALGAAAGDCRTCKQNQAPLGYAIGGGAFWGSLVGAVWRTGGWRKVYER